jgi:fructokinase
LPQNPNPGFACIEGGGTTWVCAIAEGKIDSFVEIVEFSTSESPEDTLAPVKSWLLSKTVDAVGVATFGPVDATKGSPTYGWITSTPKPGWRNTNVLQLLGLYELKGVPFEFDTDVNAPAAAEQSVSGSGRSSCAYITIGTGVGVGLVVNGETVKGLLHPEAGHIMIKPRKGDDFAGSCPFHGGCIEGMCSTGALADRLQINRSDLPDLPDEHPIWDICAYYIAQLCANLVLIASPERIVLGGGVMKRSCLYEKIRKQTLVILNNYIVSPLLTEERIGEYICTPTWGDRAGLVGSAYLAKQAFDRKLSASV